MKTSDRTITYRVPLVPIENAALRRWVWISSCSALVAGWLRYGQVTWLIHHPDESLFGVSDVLILLSLVPDVIVVIGLNHVGRATLMTGFGRGLALAWAANWVQYAMCWLMQLTLVLVAWITGGRSWAIEHLGFVGALIVVIGSIILKIAMVVVPLLLTGIVSFLPLVAAAASGMEKSDDTWEAMSPFEKIFGGAAALIVIAMPTYVWLAQEELWNAMPLPLIVFVFGSSGVLLLYNLIGPVAAGAYMSLYSRRLGLPGLVVGLIHLMVGLFLGSVAVDNVMGSMSILKSLVSSTSQCLEGLERLATHALPRIAWADAALGTSLSVLFATLTFRRERKTT